MTLTSDRGAVLSADGAYRYRLWRVVGPRTQRVCFVMLNPSTADANIDDPTIRRCMGFARAWHFGRLDVVNLFAYRATDPGELRSVDLATRVGPDNDAHIRCAFEEAHTIVVAWGAHPLAVERAWGVLALDPRGDRKPLCLGSTASGAPRHPLYVRSDATLVQWRTP